MRNRSDGPPAAAIHPNRQSSTSPHVLMRCLAVIAVVAGLLPLAPTPSRAAAAFSDVPFTHTFHEDISWLASRGVTKGCNPPSNDRFCPDEAVTRGEMAAFMVRALGYLQRLDDPFVDDDGSTFEADIERLAAAGVTKGCNPPSNTRFCPSDVVTRGQMAAFLHRAIDPSGSGFPSPNTTGFTGAGVAAGDLKPSGSITTSRDGQVIERVDVSGQIKILHDNVTIQDSRINVGGGYAIRVEKVDGECPRGTVIRYVEIDGSGSGSTAVAYDEGCGWTWDHVYMHDTTDGIKTYGPSTFTNSYFATERYTNDGAHRTALGFRGPNQVIRNNVLICNVPQGGCSAALTLYSYPRPIVDVLVEGNFLAATAAYCAYGGAVQEFGDQAANVDFFNNAFSMALTPETPDECGRAGNITAHRNGVDGNERAGNYIYETGQPID